MAQNRNCNKPPLLKDCRGVPAENPASEVSTAVDLPTKYADGEGVAGVELKNNQH